MSSAFVREVDDPGPEAPLERTVSAHRNLVTKRGLALMDETLAKLSAAIAKGADEAEIARLKRDQRYWAARRASAEVAHPQGAPGEVLFGSRVTFRRDGGAPQTMEIVGEDEADPNRGRLSWVAPIAAAMLGAARGETVTLDTRDPPIELEILAVESAD